MMLPVMKAAIDVTSTAAAARSLICLIAGSISGVMKSNVFSIQVLIISASQTIAITITNAIISRREGPNIIIPDNTSMVAARCSLALCSSSKKYLTPAPAYRRLFHLALQENVLSIILKILKSDVEAVPVYHCNLLEKYMITASVTNNPTLPKSNE